MGNMLGNGTSQDVGELLKSIIERLFGEEGDYWMEVYKKTHRKENPFEEGVVINPYRKEIKSWEKFYKKVFSENYDFSDILMPEKPKGNYWLIILAKGMKPQRLFEKCRDKFGAWKWTKDDLDKIVTSERTADVGHYAIWVRTNIEADPEFKNLSANKLKELGHQGITLEERLVLGLFYFWETKKDLDIQNWTLCSGSRVSDGSVLCMHFNLDTGGVSVDHCHPDGAVNFLRSREAVS